MLSVFQMALVGILSALLSSMSVWADKLSDVRLSLNDWYMATLMTGWMFLLEGLLLWHTNFIVIGVCVVAVSFALIRTQAFVSIKQYIQGMIPHHSMAVLMSRRLQEKYGDAVLYGLSSSIITSQEEEIKRMKYY